MWSNLIFFLTVNFTFFITLKGEENWMDLFNGDDLTGWHNPYPHGEFRVTKGIIELVANKKFF